MDQEMACTYPRNTPHRAFVSLIPIKSVITHYIEARKVILTPLGSLSTYVLRLQSQISLLFYPKSMSPIDGHNNPGQHHAKLRT